ncbi:MAG: methionyl-tRNA formyltransferase [Sphingobacteriales bacterium]|nr:MAG: methionyl-tRNA formyltransferase [Sphingobacteriales bacterium]
MDYTQLRIVFMGTPEFARASLQQLVEGGCNIVGVITAPDKPAGRGMKLQQSAVKEYALQQNLAILQPEKLKNPEFLAALRNLHADLQVVVAFRMLPELVWNMPPMGTINLHGSLLPKYRGAAPINWAVINGEKETGVTTFKLKHDIDTGDILLQQEIPIGPEENTGEVHDKMKEIGAAVLLETELKHAPKIFTDTCRINWIASAEEIHNLVRGLSPYPAAFATLQEKMFKIYACQYRINAHNETPGTVLMNDGKLAFACTNGYVYPTIVQMEGKKKMAVDDFMRGFKLAIS